MRRDQISIRGKTYRALRAVSRMRGESIPTIVDALFARTSDADLKALAMRIKHQTVVGIDAKLTVIERMRADATDAILSAKRNKRRAKQAERNQRYAARKLARLESAQPTVVAAIRRAMPLKLIVVEGKLIRRRRRLITRMTVRGETKVARIFRESRAYVRSLPQWNHRDIGAYGTDARRHDRRHRFDMEVHHEAHRRLKEAGIEVES